MCNWGTDTEVLLITPAHLSHNGVSYQSYRSIDSCIVPLILALNDAGIHTSGCCCGHGKSDGSVILHDGTEINIDIYTGKIKQMETKSFTLTEHQCEMLFATIEYRIDHLEGLEGHDFYKARNTLESLRDLAQLMRNQLKNEGHTGK